MPPHLCNLLTVSGSRRLLHSTDALMGRIPAAARHGGLILAEAFRGGRPLVMPEETLRRGLDIVAKAVSSI